MDFREDVFLGMKRPIVPPLMNGGGCCKTVEHVRDLSRSLAGGILVGSFTKERRDGNPGNVFWTHDGAALNSLGMPNGGAQYLADHLGEMVRIAHGRKQALIVNVAGFSAAEYCELAEMCIEDGADAVELNLGCPNVMAGRGRKPIASFDMEVMVDILSQVEKACGKDAPIWVKVSPYSDPGLIARAAGIILAFPCVKAVTAINTFPNAYGMNHTGKSAISAGLAGLSGKPLKHIGLGQIKQWYDALGGGAHRVELIAAGGIMSGRDIVEYQLLGADAFQMTTALLSKGTLDAKPFEKVAAEYLDSPA